VVVGAGALGLCTAFEITELGLTDVVVLERDHVASASSGLSVGIVETQYLDPLAIELRVHSMRFFRRLETEAGLSITRNGYLRLGHSPADLAAFERSVEAQRDLGVADAAVLDQEDCAGSCRTSSAATWPGACSARVAKRLAHRLPGLAGARLAGTWAGIYPVSPDGSPAVGPYRDRPSVVAALGKGVSGLQSSPAIGRIAAEWIVHGEPRTIPAADALLPDRLSGWVCPEQLARPFSDRESPASRSGPRG
jgi:glycine/D-amino acid oxidase-like deaminating enzyme